MAAPRIGIVANTSKPGAAAAIARLQGLFEAEGCPVTLDAETARFCQAPTGPPLTELIDAIDLIVLLGGDGTILHLAKALGPKIKPIAAINTGTLGFLTLGTANDLDAIAKLVAEGRYGLSQRSVIGVQAWQEETCIENCFALNEVSVGRGGISRMVHVHVRVDGGFVSRYSGDGLIVATPTGSTAYSLSAGGPLIEPGSSVFCITPVCPHSLSIRPVVVADRGLIQIDIPHQRDAVFMTTDGQNSHQLAPPSRIEIRRAPFTIPLITRSGASFFEVLREKLDWSGSSAS